MRSSPPIALIAGPRERERREPWMMALGAAAMAFFAGRDAFVDRRSSQWMIGVVPVVLGAVTARAAARSCCGSSPPAGAT